MRTLLGSLCQNVEPRLLDLPDLVTAQDARPEALCVSGDTERIYQDFRFLGDGLDDVPALLFGSGDE